MVKRTCPSCGQEVYSADTFSEYWTCCHCGARIPKESPIELWLKKWGSSLDWEAKEALRKAVEEEGETMSIGYTRKPGSQVMAPANKMTRYEKLISKSVEETAAWIVKQNFTDEFCKSDCKTDWENGCCTDELATECCIRWLMEEVGE